MTLKKREFTPESGSVDTYVPDADSEMLYPAPAKEDIDNE